MKCCITKTYPLTMNTIYTEVTTQSKYTLAIGEKSQTVSTFLEILLMLMPTAALIAPHTGRCFSPWSALNVRREKPAPQRGGAYTFQWESSVQKAANVSW